MMSVERILEHVGYRRRTFEVAVDLLRRRRATGLFLVETGTLRSYDDGCSTVLWATLARELRSRFLSIDADPHAPARAQRLMDTRLYRAEEFLVSDSVRALSLNTHPIDLLYLDSMDAVPGTDYQGHQLREVQAASPALHPGAVVVIDDDQYDTGKGALSRRWFLEHGWSLLKRDYQSVLFAGDGVKAAVAAEKNRTCPVS